MAEEVDLQLPLVPYFAMFAVEVLLVGLEVREPLTVGEVEEVLGLRRVHTGHDRGPAGLLIGPGGRPAWVRVL